MADQIVFRVEGLRELQKALRQTSEQTPKVIQSAHKDVAEIVAQEARRNAAGTTLGPRIRAFGTTRQAGVRFLGHKPKGASKTTDAFLQEFGGRAPLFGNKDRWFTVKPKKKSGYFIYPALASTRQEVFDRYMESLDRALKQHWSA